ncbi:MAG: anti-sigma regulatory factor, partial [Steroidobacteraceae bacterium]
MTPAASDVLAIRSSDDVVRVRQLVRTHAVAVGLSLVDQTKIVTAASELARNTLDYGGGGSVRVEQLADGGRRGVR